MKFTITAVAAALLVPAVSAIDQYCPHAVVRLDCSTSAVWTDFKTYVSQQLEAKYNARYGNPGNDLPKYYLNNTVWQSPIGNAEEPGMLGAKKKGGSVYNGGAGCRLCAPRSFMPEDDGMLGVNWAPWAADMQSELVNGVNSAAFADTTNCTVILSTANDLCHSAPYVLPPLVVLADCHDVKWDKLSEQEQDFSAQAVMEAYNELHQELSGGDKSLHKVDFLFESAGNLRAAVAGASFMMHGNSDVDADDALTMELLQTKFQAKLRDGPYVAFANANGCQFNMDTKEQVNAAE